MPWLVPLCLCLALVGLVSAVFIASVKNARALRRNLDERFDAVQIRLEQQANALADELNWAGNHPGRKQFLEVVKLARPGVFVPGFWDVTSPLNDAFNAIVEEGKDPKAALDEVAPQMQDSLDKAWETWEQIK